VLKAGLEKLSEKLVDVQHEGLVLGLASLALLLRVATMLGGHLTNPPALVAKWWVKRGQLLTVLPQVTVSS
jgi:hypothetical protein